MTDPPKPDDPAQSQRFIDMAHEVGADEADAAFEVKMKAIARHKPKRPETANDKGG